MTFNGVLSLLALLGLIGLPTSAGAEVYKWIDENGKVQFGDQPPPGAKTQPVKLRPSGGFAAPKTNDEVKVQTAGSPQQNQVDKQFAARNCQLATQNLDNASTADVVIIKDKDGTERQVGAQDKVDEVERMRKERDRWCAMAK